MGRKKDKEFMTKGAERVLRWSFLIPAIVGVIVILLMALMRGS